MRACCVFRSVFITRSTVRVSSKSNLSTAGPTTPRLLVVVVYYSTAARNRTDDTHTSATCSNSEHAMIEHRKCEVCRVCLPSTPARRTVGNRARSNRYVPYTTPHLFTVTHPIYLIFMQDHARPATPFAYRCHRFRYAYLCHRARRRRWKPASSLAAGPQTLLCARPTKAGRTGAWQCRMDSEASAPPAVLYEDDRRPQLCVLPRPRTSYAYSVTYIHVHVW